MGDLIFPTDPPGNISPVKEMKTPEAFQAVVSEAQDSRPGTSVLADPTQVRRPWRSTVRTAFQALVALAVLFPVLVETSGLEPEAFPWLAIPVAVAAGFARVMALPQVEVFLKRFVPFLAAAPAATQKEE